MFNQANGIEGQQPPAAPTEPTPQVEPAAVEPPAAQAAPAPAEPATPPVPPVAATPDWEQKYRTLQGVFSAESGRMTAEKKALELRIAALEQAQATPAPAPQAPAQLVTDKDIETYGPEMMDVIGRKATEIAQQIVAQQIAAQKPQLDQLNAQVSNVQAAVYRTNEDKFFGELTKLVPDWQALNQDDGFLTWLGEVDPLSGVPRQQYMDNAAGKYDYNRAAALFNTYRPQTPAPVVAAPAAPAAPSPSPRPVGTASAPSINAPVVGVKRSEIQAHYRRGSTDATYRDSAAHQAFEVRMQQALANNQVTEA